MQSISSCVKLVDNMEFVEYLKEFDESEAINNVKTTIGVCSIERLPYVFHDVLKRVIGAP